jgi:Transposase DDE domain
MQINRRSRNVRVARCIPHFGQRALAGQSVRTKRMATTVNGNIFATIDAKHLNCRFKSVLTRIRNRLGEEVFEAVFRRIVSQCQQKGLVKGPCRVMTDATLMAADASLDSLVHNDPEQAQIEADSRRRRRGRLDPSANRRVSNRTHRSRTDPEASLAQKRGTALQLKYKVHQTIDAESRVILDAEVTTGGRHDNQPYLEQLRRVEDRCHCTIQEATADRGYGSAEILKALKAKGAKTYIPLWHGRSGRNSAAAVGMNYEPKQDRIRCPAGKYFYPNPANYENRKRFVSLPAACRGCPLAASCPAKARSRSPHTRFVLRPLDQDLFDEVQTQMNEPDFVQKVAERMWKCEGLFAEAKQFHGLSRAKYHG